jgi:putative colanic acid biosynthesis acetyltransferase WcaF
MLLRLFGARVAATAKVSASVKVFAPWNLTIGEYSCISYDVDFYNVAPIVIGAHSTVSQYSYLCTASHDMDDPTMKLTTAPITIGDGAWICADVFVAPGVTIGDAAVVGARSSVFVDVPAWTVAAGNPCKVLRPRNVPRDDATADPESVSPDHH